jgi:Ala-tRNA(Pro) deacylase
MTIPAKLQHYLAEHKAAWDVFEHARTASSAQTLRVTHLPAERLAKSVVLEDDNGYLMVVLPASGRVHLGQLSRQLDRRLRLATEPEVARLFDDCDPGAVPAVGQAYGVQTMVEDELMGQPEIYFEAGDHTELIHMSRQQFIRLMADARHGHFMAQPH